MRKIFIKSLFLLLLIGLLSLIKPIKSFAQGPFPSCGFKVSSDPPDKQVGEYQFKRGFKSLTFIFNLSTITEDDWSNFSDTNPTDGKPDILNNGLELYPGTTACLVPMAYFPNVEKNMEVGKTVDLTFPLGPCNPLGTGSHTLPLKYDKAGKHDLCTGTYEVLTDKGAVIETLPIDINGNSVPGDTNAYWKISISNVRWDDGLAAVWSYVVDFNGNNLNAEAGDTPVYDRRNLGGLGNALGTDVTFILKPLDAGDYTIDVIALLGVGIAIDKKIATKTFAVYPEGKAPSATPIPSPTIPPPPGTTYTPIPPIPSLQPLCDQLPTTNNFRSNCWNCINTGGIWTAIGCVPTNWEGIINNYVFPIGTGVGGGISFLYFLYGVFLILTSGGNAEKIAEGKEIIISALSGLLLIIFSVFLLRVIGYDILRIPGFL